MYYMKNDLDLVCITETWCSENCDATSLRGTGHVLHKTARYG